MKGYFEKGSVMAEEVCGVRNTGDTRLSRLDDETLLALAVELKAEIRERRSRADRCYEIERKSQVPLIGNGYFAFPWILISALCLIYGLSHDWNANGYVPAILLFIGVAMGAACVYFSKRMGAFWRSFASRYPMEARLLRWKY